MIDPQASAHHPAGSARPHWGAEALWQALVPLLPGLSIEVVQTLESTNSELTDRLRNAGRVQQARRGGRMDDLYPQMLVAIDQTAGRGRLGRRWHSSPGSSLTFSLALPLHRADWSGLSLAVGLALAEALEPDGRRLRLKWPNDLVVADAGEPAGEASGLGRKLGGILIESVSVGEQRAAVIGIGINVLPQPAADADYGTSALTELWPEATPQGRGGRGRPNPRGGGGRARGRGRGHRRRAEGGDGRPGASRGQRRGERATGGDAVTRRAAYGVGPGRS